MVGWDYWPKLQVTASASKGHSITAVKRKGPKRKRPGMRQTAFKQPIRKPVPNKSLQFKRAFKTIQKTIRQSTTNSILRKTSQTNIPKISSKANSARKTISKHPKPFQINLFLNTPPKAPSYSQKTDNLKAQSPKGRTLSLLGRTPKLRELEKTP